MKLLDDYFDLQSRIFQYFGYVEDWRAIPLDDKCGDYWMIIGAEDSSDTSVVHSPTPFTEESITEGKEIFGNTLYTQRFLPKWVYRAAEFTMVCVDTHTDGNKFLMVFDNRLECTDESLKALYAEKWGRVWC